MDNVIPDPGFRGFARSVGEVLSAGVLKSLRPKMEVMRQAQGGPDIPLELLYERKLRAAAFEASDRGATISVIRSGFMVRKGPKIEIVRFDQVTADVLLRALNRVAPHVWETAGFDHP